MRTCAPWDTGGLAEIATWRGVDELPFHTLPYDELLERLRALTNLRVVEDPGSATGYRVDIGPFPGWATVPTT